MSFAGNRHLISPKTAKSGLKDAVLLHPGKIMSDILSFCSRNYPYSGFTWERALNTVVLAILAWVCKENVHVFISVKLYQVLQDIILTSKSSSQQSPECVRYLSETVRNCHLLIYLTENNVLILTTFLKKNDCLQKVK